MPFAVKWMDLEIIVLREVCQTKKNIMYHLSVESKKMIQINLFIKYKTTYRLWNQTRGYQSWKVWDGMDWELGIGTHTVVYVMTGQWGQAV